VSDDSQIEIPRSFVELFIPEGRSKPAASRAEIHERYEFCEDLAQALTERARTLLWELQVTEADVLHRIMIGLEQLDPPVPPAEATWVVTRLAELLDWRDQSPVG
jgi:hypothetical protein